MLKRSVFVLTVSVFLVLSFAVHSKAGAQGGTPHPPMHTVPTDQSTITQGSTIQLCAQAADDITSEIHFEVFQGPIDDFSTPWGVANPQGVNTCAGLTLPNGHYTWHARARNSAGEGGNAPDWVFTLQVGDTPPPTRIPGPGASGGSGNGGGPPPLSSAQQQGVPGGVDLIVYCYATGYTGAGNTNGTADGWVCTRDNVSTPVDWNLVCKAVYGDNYVANKTSNNPDGWRCVQGGQQSSQSNGSGNSPPANCNGVLSPRLTVGQNATVTEAGDQLRLRAGDGLDQPVEGNMKTGDIALVIGGPRCTDGYNWWQLQTQKYGTWWAVEADGQDYWLQPGGILQRSPTITSTSKPQTAVVPTALPTALVAAIKITAAAGNIYQILLPIGKYLATDEFQKLVDEVKHVYDSALCLPDIAIVAWSMYHGEPTIPIDMAEHCEPFGEDILQKIYDAISNQKKEGGPIASRPGIANGSTKAMGISWSFCVGCTSHAWMDFRLPAGHYDRMSFRLTFMGKDIHVEDVSISSEGSVDIVSLHVSATTIQQQIDAGYDSKLSDLANWILYYTVTK